MSPASPQLPPGFELVGPLGSGGFGEVFLARQTAIGRLVAVKQILPHALADPEHVERFRREAQVLATTDCPSVVSVYDFRVAPSGAMLLMEYVPGDNLLDLMSGQRLPADEAIRILRDVADALGVMARRGIVHRDVKPGNVFVMPDGHAKLGDFGLARAMADTSSFRTAGGAPSGTPAYFPPEVSQLTAEPSPVSDAYSFAVMAYETLTGVRPIEAADALALVIAHWNQPPRPPGDVVPGFPAVAARALLAGLEKEPGQRLLPGDLVDRLELVPPDSWPPAPPRVPSTAPAPTASVPVASVPSGRVARATPAAGIAAGVLVAMVALGVATAVDDEALAVTGLEVTVLADEGQCPTATFRFTAVVRTNGEAGSLRLQWTRPDGTSGQAATIQVASGKQSVSTRLDFQVRGRQPLSGAAVLTVLEPGRADDSARMTYRCPSADRRQPEPARVSGTGH
ncbi:MAG: serine/threonine-protein kinase [Nocardioides sp.]|nr:serine/threonine-protein kinase [Nocardioides sp.]